MENNRVMMDREERLPVACLSPSDGRQAPRRFAAQAGILELKAEVRELRGQWTSVSQRWEERIHGV